MQKNEYNDYIDQETGEVATAAPVVTVVKATKKEIAVKDTGQKYINAIMAQAKSYALTSGRSLKPAQERLMSDNVALALVKINENKNWNFKNLRMVECGFYTQLVSTARLGLSMKESDVWLDVRKNGKASYGGETKYDINLSLQYQGRAKLLIQYGSVGGHNIIDVGARVIYKNETFKLSPNKKEILVYDEFEWENDEEEKAYKNNLENVKCAYATMTVDMGNREKDYLEIIKKPRILMAKEKSTSVMKTDYATKKKTVDPNCAWIKHPESMVEKTALNVLFNKKRSFIKYSTEFGLDIKEAKLDEVNEERKFDNSIDVETEVKDEACNKELGVTF